MAIAITPKLFKDSDGKRFKHMKLKTIPLANDIKPMCVFLMLPMANVIKPLSCLKRFRW